MKFRELPKRRLVLMVPEDVYAAVMEVWYRDKRERSRSEHGASALARGLGIEPQWDAPLFVPDAASVA